MKTDKINQNKLNLGNIFQVGSAKRIKESLIKIYEIVEEMHKRLNQLEKQVNGNKTIDKDFEKELQKIKGVGKKTAKDIVNVYPTEQDLIEAVQKGEHLPFTNDIEKKLKWKYSRK